MSKKIQFCKHIKTQFWKYIYPVLAALFIGFIPAFCVQWIFHDPPPKRLISEYMYYKLEDEKEDIHAYGFLIFNNDKNKIIDNIECEINFVSTKLELKQAKTFPKSF